MASSSTRLLIIRHGETDWNVQARCQGHLDIPLNETGHKQALAAAEKLALISPNCAALYSSDLTRALQTAAPIALKYGLEVIAHKHLREAHQGEAQGLYRAEIRERFAAERTRLDTLYPDMHERWNYAEIPGSESRNQLLARLLPTLQNYAFTHSGQTITVVTHAGVIKTLVTYVGAAAAMESLKFTNCLIAEFQYKADKAALTFTTFHK